MVGMWRFSSVSADPAFLEVTIEPSRPQPVKLSVGEPCIFTAKVDVPAHNVTFWNWGKFAFVTQTFPDFDTGPLMYTWTDSAGKILGNHQTLNFSFSVPCNGTFLHLTVVGNKTGYGEAIPMWVADPYSQPSYYLTGQNAPYTTLVEADGKGWYQGVNGLTGEIRVASMNASLVIQNAATFGGIIHVGSGNYQWSGTIRLLTPNTILTGAGNSTTIEAPIGSRANLVSVEASGCQVTDIHFLGHHWSSTGQDGWIIGDGTTRWDSCAACIWIGATQPISGVRVENCYANNYGWFINAAGAGNTATLYDTWIVNNYVQDMGDGMMFNGANNDRLHIEGNTIINTYDDAINVNGAPGGIQFPDDYFGQNIIISGNTVLHNNINGGGIKIDANGAILRKITVTSNIVQNSSTGIYIQNWWSSDTVHVPTELTVSNNVVSVQMNPGQTGTAVGIRYDSNGNTPLEVNSEISNNIVTSPRNWGIKLKGISNCRLSGNIIDESSIGINLFDTCAFIDIDSNTISGYKKGWSTGIYVSNSAQVDIHNNHIEQTVYNNLGIQIINSDYVTVTKNVIDGGLSDTRIVPLFMSGTSDFAIITDNVFKVNRESAFSFVGNQTYIRGNRLQTTDTPQETIRMNDYSGTMTGVTGESFTYEKQLGTVLISVAAEGVQSATVNYTYQYPTGGATNGGPPVPIYSLINPTNIDFTATLTIDNISAAGFRISVNVENASVNSTAKVEVAWVTELPESW
ncbi:MAG: right-handed parallel beta-helix repeat-containing protein [Candidatus Bathyarchaeota archaeon]|nr:right-handed parallel beta-helix repeat-containing protein [Candidatus Bathyarchaeota archaeon]